MEFDELKSMWSSIAPQTKTDDEIREMLKENKHPVLKSIRKQFAIEITGWFAFLICYYSMFDGATKPMLINIVLVIAIITPLIHNLYGYNFAKYLVDAPTVKKSLEGYLVKMRIFMFSSITTRVIFLSGLFTFFAYGIDFDSSKYFLLAAVILAMVFFQGFFLYKIWMKRIMDLRNTLMGLS